MTTKPKRKVKRGEHVNAKPFLEELRGGPLTLGAMLTSHREGEGMTQQDVADLLGVSRQRVCDYEKGRRVPKPHLAWKFAESLNLSGAQWARKAIEEMLGNEGIFVKVSLETVKKSSKRVA